MDTKDKMIMCPAVMFANKRTVNANGFVKIPITSIGIMIINNGTGTPGVAKMCFQQFLFPENTVTNNVRQANTTVTAIFPVKFAPNNGINPVKLLIKIKKNIVNR